LAVVKSTSLSHAGSDTGLSRAGHFGVTGRRHEGARADFTIRARKETPPWNMRKPPPNIMLMPPSTTKRPPSIHLEAKDHHEEGDHEEAGHHAHLAHGHHKQAEHHHDAAAKAALDLHHAEAEKD
jgi:hypothetical protein